jgi:hypothetical protein
VQREAWRVAGIRERLAVERAVVDALATNGSAGLAQVNANLVGPSRFQAAFHEREFTQVFQDADMRHGPLSRYILLVSSSRFVLFLVA